MKQILVVDNDDSTVHAIAELLCDNGYDASTATTGEQALAKVFATRPDLLVFDLFMPYFDGWQLLEVIARDPSLARMAKIAMTAWPRPLDLPSGVTLLHKPFECESLARLVRTALRPSLPRLPRDLESSRAVPLLAG
jgi:CheY-like chemotaxis protein